MIDLILIFAILIGSFYFLIRSSDYLVISASIIGKRLGFSKFIIGLTIVAIGTSLPELATAIIGVITSPDNPQAFVFGTVVGSNIANLMLIFGLLLFFSTNFKSKIRYNDITMLIMSTVVLFAVVFYGLLNWMIGLLMISFYIYYLYTQIKTKNRKDIEEEAEEATQENNYTKQVTWVLVLIFVLNLITINVSAKGIIFAIQALGTIFQIPLAFLTLTTVALATSLPEASVTYACAKSKDFDIAIGNIIGSNISNVFLIIGITGLVKSFTFSPQNFIPSLFVLIFATVIFLVSIIKYKYTNKYIGITFIVLYLGYIVSTIF